MNRDASVRVETLWSASHSHERRGEHEEIQEIDTGGAS